MGRIWSIVGDSSVPSTNKEDLIPIQNQENCSVLGTRKRNPLAHNQQISLCQEGFRSLAWLGPEFLSHGPPGVDGRITKQRPVLSTKQPQTLPWQCPEHTCKHHHAAGGVEPIHLNQQCIQCALTLIIATTYGSNKRQYAGLEQPLASGYTTRHWHQPQGMKSGFSAPALPPLRLLPMASISSMKMIHGAFLRASLNMSRTRDGP